MQDIYSNYYKKKLLLILYASLKTEMNKRSFRACHVKSVNSKQMGVKIYKTFGLMKRVL